MSIDGPAAFFGALRAVPACDRDRWVDRVLGLDEIPADGADLPPGGVPYLPCGVEVLLSIIDSAAITTGDVVVDIGAGVGRALAIVQRLTGAGGIGVEVQSALVARAVPGVTMICGDVDVIELPVGSVYLLYCPFSGARIARFLEKLARVPHPIRVACIDVTLPPCDWLSAVSYRDMTVYWSTERTSPPSLEG